MRSPRSGAEIPTGAHPGNTGGKKGRSGRKPAEWAVFCGDVLRDPATREAIRQAARDATGRGFAALIKLLAEDAGVKAPAPKQMQHSPCARSRVRHAAPAVCREAGVRRLDLFAG